LKIGLLTYHFSDNYGALFQAYALRHWFQSKGHEVEFINYHPAYVEEGGAFNFLKPLTKSNLKIIYLKLTKIKEDLFGNKQQKENFNNFRHDILGVNSDVEFKSLEDLNGKLNGYDMLVCGSDQIWKPSEHYGVDPVYFLDFTVKGKQPKKVAYAPSFGKDTLDAEYQSETCSLINKLDAVSVREESGCNIVQEITGNLPLSVPDPTFLLDEYASITKKYPDIANKHVFCYALRSRDAIGDVAEGIAKKLDSALYSPHNSHRRWKEIGETVYPCPQQWLYLLNKSEFVVTNSFHGTALSILLNKPFVVVGLQGNKSRFNARVKNLLKALNLESRFVQVVNEYTVEQILNSTIDWDKINQDVASLRDKGQAYLNLELSKLFGDL